MTFSVTYPPAGGGRGSFVTYNTVLGGTLNITGTGPGRYYRAPANASVRMPGLTAALAIRTYTPCSVNDYAVFMFIKHGLQPFLNTACDGVLGPKSSAGIISLQKARGLVPDGVIGPKTCRMLQEPLIITSVAKTDPDHSGLLLGMVLGTINYESAFDGGAVGVSTPHDLGVGQISEVHSALPSDPKFISTNDRLIPAKAIIWIVAFIAENLRAMNYDLDLAIMAYNLGITGSWDWDKAGRPEVFRGTNTWSYLSAVKNY